ncbi:MAG: DoxX family membrane protein [Candidatus Binatia bacterium]|nr:DoxX family membrane protein [Candidatus Binatia bacterium]
MDANMIVRFLATAFFAVTFLQSGLDKVLDRDGNLQYLTEHFRNSPLSPFVPQLLTVITVIELIAGGLCGLGLLLFDFRQPGLRVAGWGVAMSGVALLCLLFGQRLAKDYAGAAVIAAYFAVVLLGLRAF